jgi:hypothetical protein
MELSGSYDGSFFETDADSEISFNSGADHGGLKDVVLDGNISNLSANVSGTITNYGTVASGGLSAYEPTTIANHGQIAASIDASNKTLTLTGGGRFDLVEAAGYSSLGRAPISNVDNQVQAEGSVNLVSNGGTVEAKPGTLTLTGPGLTHTGLLRAPTGSTIEVGVSATGTGAWLADGG